jgi:ubiquinone/menaquinone biosynthesis C-methylase UbiE
MKNTLNPNNKTAEIYDIFTRPLKGDSITNEEISLINFLAEPGSKILDIGAGTGRHAITLSEQGYKITAVDSSKEMLNVLDSKFDPSSGSGRNSKIKLINKDILSYKPLSNNYELIILMWNSFNEIALTKGDAKKLLKKLKKALAVNGKILINIDDAEKVDPSNFYFETEFLNDGYTFKQTWKTSAYNRSTNTSISEEIIEVIKEGKVIDKRISKIKQRYWRISELQDLCKQSDLKLETHKLIGNEELYLIINS